MLTIYKMNTAINDKAFELIKGLTSAKIVDAWIEGKWLVALLETNMTFRVLNNI